MDKSIKLKHIFLILIIGVIGYFGYQNKELIQGIFQKPHEKVVNNALNYLNEQNFGSRYDYFSDSYVSNLLSNYSFYKIDSWSLWSMLDSTDRYVISVYGNATNAFGMELERNPKFVVSKESGEWKIIDSYNFFVFDDFESVLPSIISDNEKNSLIEELKEKLIIEKWSYRSTYGGAVKGNATIFNGSNLPVEFVKLEITYYDNNDNVVNTDETYAVGGEVLRPQNRRKIEWYTSYCSDCKKASVRLKFN